MSVRQVPLPAVTVSADPNLAAIVPPSVAERLGMAPRVVAFGVGGAEHRVTEAEEKRLEEVLAGFDGDIRARVYVERGPHRPGDMLVPMLAVVAVVLTLGGSLAATGLAAADARPDLATLAAVGAGLRLLPAGQAGFVAALGCWLGIAAGLVPGIAAARPLSDRPLGPGGPVAGLFLEIPWPVLLAAGVAVPLVAALVAGLCVRSRLPVTRAGAA